MSRRTNRRSTQSSRLAARLSANELDFKEDLRRAREDADLSQRAVAAKLGVAPSTISRLERLDSDLTLSQIRHYAWAVGVDLTFSVAPAGEAASESGQLASQTTGALPSSPDVAAGVMHIAFRSTPGSPRSYADGFFDGWKEAEAFHEVSDEEAEQYLAGV
ncbi:helix-turn-helix domain-containing protein [Rhodococcus rhodnii]|nr:helix-turn-helix transcriptional regulator [Rhodococcus rhodnii]